MLNPREGMVLAFLWGQMDGSEGTYTFDGSNSNQVWKAYFDGWLDGFKERAADLAHGPTVEFGHDLTVHIWDGEE